MFYLQAYFMYKYNILFYKTINTKAPFYVIIKSENRFPYIQEKQQYSNQQDPRIKTLVITLRRGRPREQLLLQNYKA